MIGRSVPHKLPVDNLALSKLAQPPQMRPKGPGVGRHILGSIGDALLQYAGASPIYAPAMQRQQDLADLEQRDARNRALDWEDYVRREEYKRANPSPVNNDTVNDYNFIRDKFGQAEADRYVRQNVIDPPRIITLPNGQFATMGGGGPPAPSGPPAEAIAELRANPATAAQFDEIFGPGAAQRVLGGASPSSGSPTFP